MRTRNKITLILSVILAILLLMIGYMSLIYVPDWYQPQYIGIEEQQNLTDEVTAISREFNNKMQRPETFEIAISARQINRFLAGIDLIAPELKELIPKNVSNPAVQLDNDEMKLGAIVKKDGKKLFASLVIKITAEDDWLIIDKFQIRIGLWPVPQAVIERYIDKFARKANRYLSDFGNILKTRRIPNHFKFPNSDYDFKVTSLKASKGVLYVTIQPFFAKRRESGQK